MFRKRLICLGISLFAAIFFCCTSLRAQLYAPYHRPLALWDVPKEISASHFTVTIEGKTTPVMRAALNNYFLNFEAGAASARQRYGGQGRFLGEGRRGAAVAARHTADAGWAHHQLHSEWAAEDIDFTAGRLRG